MITTWLKNPVGAYRSACLRGMLLDGPCHWHVARMREPAASEQLPAVALPAPRHRVHIDTIRVPPTRLEPNP